MRLSEILFSKVKEIWDVSVSKPFVIEMAKGTLDEDLFKHYMIQDYLYLQDYIGILKRIRDISGEEEITCFLDSIIDETISEVERVHIPNMNELGISEDDIVKTGKLNVISEYTEFMRKCIDEHGMLGGLTGMLQCSWVYAYISKTSLSEYREEISKSKYHSWFEDYSCDSYVNTNRMWIDFLDKQSAGIDEAKTDELCQIFIRCAGFENELWDALYN